METPVRLKVSNDSDDPSSALPPVSPFGIGSPHGAECNPAVAFRSRILTDTARGPNNEQPPPVKADYA